ncbi:MAG: PorT family protein [Bacteroidales bacterium]|nr:PorT family protein [Bacteroidales bacterium]
MKKAFLIGLVIILIIPAISYSQVKPFRFGFKISPNLAWISPDAEGYEANGSSFGFSWGFLSDIAITENYFISTGFGVDYLGGKLKYPYQGSISTDTIIQTGDMSRNYKLRNLEIPITLKMRTNQFGKIAYYGQIGFGTSFNLKSKADDDFSYYENDQKYSEKKDDVDIKDDIKFMRSSLIFAAGIEYFLDESTSLVGGLSFNSGLTNILKGENTVDPNVKQKGSLYYFQLNIGILF